MKWSASAKPMGLNILLTAELDRCYPHEGYIPWDDDIDLVMLREDYDKFVQIAPKWLKEDLVLQTVYTEKNYLRGHAQIRNSKTCGCNEEDKKAGYNCGIFIDIFPLTVCRKRKKKEKLGQKDPVLLDRALYLVPL